LALEVRPDLSWRDIQHLCVTSAVQVNPEDPDWELTAVGRPYSYKYGYGKLDAGLYIEAARDWKLVKSQAWLEIPTIELAGADMTPDGHMSGGEFIASGGIRSSTDISRDMLLENNFDRLEHVTVKVWIKHDRRGDVEVELVSPNGVKSILAAARKLDEDKNGFVGWQFMTLKHWDENATGKWTLRVSDQARDDRNGSFLGWSMILWGSALDESKTRPWVLPNPEASSMPSQEVSPTPTSDPSAATKVHPKPTAALPSDHADAPGEAHKPGLGQEDDAASGPTTTPTPDEGYFSHMYDLLKSQTWLFGAIGAVLLFAIAVGVFLWRRRVRQRSRVNNYDPVAAEDDLQMGSLEAGGVTARTGRKRTPRTKELYDAFGEVSDDDEDADENMALTGRGEGDLGSHSRFLDDDDKEAVARYSDHPSPAKEDDASSGSGDGSWEHASDTRG